MNTILDQLYAFQDYEAGWDGEDALPLNIIVVKNIKSVLSKTTDDLLVGWMLSPEINGTILLKRDDNQASINLGANEYSYFLITCGSIKGENGAKFSVKGIRDLLRKMKQ